MGVYILRNLNQFLEFETAYEGIFNFNESHSSIYGTVSEDALRGNDFYDALMYFHITCFGLGLNPVRLFGYI